MMAAYGQKHMITPHLDAFAATGTVFNRAYCQQAICGPTRNSFLSGRRPQRTQAWNFIGAYCSCCCSSSRCSSRCSSRSAADLFEIADHFREPKGGTTGNEPARTEDGGLWVSLPGYFKTNGYISMGGGKTYAAADPCCLRCCR